MTMQGKQERREFRNPTTHGVEARGAARLAADLNGHVAEPFRTILNNVTQAGAATTAAPLVVCGQGEYRTNGNGRLLDDDASRAIARANPTATPPVGDRYQAKLAEIRGCADELRHLKQLADRVCERLKREHDAHSVTMTFNGGTVQVCIYPRGHEPGCATHANIATAIELALSDVANEDAVRAKAESMNPRS